jgi:dipicolinate synthase subunit B
MDLVGNAENIGKLLNRKNYFFIPFSQDNYTVKPFSLVFDISKVIETIDFALRKEQIQPILI